MAINVYTDMRDIKKSRVVGSNDIFFNSIKDSIKIDDTIKDIIHTIDKSEYIGGTFVKTRYGEVIDMCDMSTGCKTVINVLCKPEKVFNCVESGGNAIRYILGLKGINAHIFLPLGFGVDSDFDTDIILHRNGNAKHFNTVGSLMSELIYG